MRRRILALMLIVPVLAATPAAARFVVMDANFDSKAPLTQLGRGGALGA